MTATIPTTPATPPSRHPSGVTLTPTQWRVETADREIGMISHGRHYYSGHHHATNGHSHIAAWADNATEAIGQLLACDRDPARCAQAQAAQDAADKQQRELRAAQEVA